MNRDTGEPATVSAESRSLSGTRLRPNLTTDQAVAILNHGQQITVTLQIPGHEPYTVAELSPVTLVSNRANIEFDFTPFETSDIADARAYRDAVEQAVAIADEWTAQRRGK